LIGHAVLILKLNFESFVLLRSFIFVEHGMTEHIICAHLIVG
jgi:hypothetical protein